MRFDVIQKKRRGITIYSVIKRLDNNPQLLGRYKAGNQWAKPPMKSVKRNKRAIPKSRPPHVEIVGSGKLQQAHVKRMLPFLETAKLRA